jgi:hypothetical protein
MEDNFIQLEKPIEKSKYKTYMPSQGHVYAIPEFTSRGKTTGISHNDFKDYYYKLASAQSTGEKWKNAGIGLTIGIASGFLDFFGTNFENPYAISKNLNDVYGDNWFHETAKNLNEIIQEQYPIYQKNPNIINFGDIGYITNGIQSMGTTLGMLGYNFAEMAILRGLGKALTGTKTIKDISKLPTTLQKFKALESMKGWGQVARQVGYGMWSGEREAIMNGLMTYDQVYEQMRDENETIENARMYAANAMSTAFNTEVGISVVLNALQFGMLGYNPTTRQVFGKFDDLLERGIKNATVRKGILYGIEAGTESFEEVWQGASSAKGQEFAEWLRLGKNPSDFKGSWFDNEYWGSTEQWNDAILGGVMGIVLPFVGNAMSKAWNMKNHSIEKELARQWRGQMTARRLENIELINQALETGNTELAQKLKDDNNFLGAASALFQDKNYEGLDSFGAYMAQMQEMLGYAQELANAQKNGDVNGITAAQEKLHQNFGIKFDVQNGQAFVDNLTESIADSNRLKELFDNDADMYKYTDDVASAILWNKFQLEKNQGELANVNAQLQTELNTTTNRGNLSQQDMIDENGNFGFSSGKTRLEVGEQMQADRANVKLLEAQQRFLEAYQKEYERRHKEILDKGLKSKREKKALESLEREMPNQKQRLDKVNTNLDIARQELSAIEKLNDVVNTKNDSWSQEQKDIFDNDTTNLNIIGTGKYQELLQAQKLYQQNISDLQKDTLGLKNEYKKSNYFQKQINQSIAAAKTEAELDGILKQVKNDSDLSYLAPQVEARINSKKNVIRKLKAQVEANKKTASQTAQKQIDKSKSQQVQPIQEQIDNQNYYRTLNESQLKEARIKHFKIDEWEDIEGKSYQINIYDKDGNFYSSMITGSLDNRNRAELQNYIDSGRMDWTLGDVMNPQTIKQQNQQQEQTTVSPPVVQQPSIENMSVEPYIPSQELSEQESMDDSFGFDREFEVSDDFMSEDPTDWQSQAESAALIDEAFDALEFATDLPSTDTEISTGDTDTTNTDKSFAIPVSQSEIQQAFEKNPIQLQNFRDALELSGSFERFLEAASKGDIGAAKMKFPVLAYIYKRFANELGMQTPQNIDKFLNDTLQKMELGNKLDEAFAAIDTQSTKLAEQERKQKSVSSKPLNEQSSQKTEPTVSKTQPRVEGLRTAKANPIISYHVFNGKLFQLKDGHYRFVPSAVDSNNPNFDFTPLLNIDNFTPGTKLEAFIPGDFMNMEVHIWNTEDNSKMVWKDEKGNIVKAPVNKLRAIGTMKFSEAIQRFPQLDKGNNDYFDEQMYNDYIPIVIQDAAQSDPDAKYLGSVHSPHWYNTRNIADENDNQTQIIDEGRKRIREQRKHIINKSNGSTGVTTPLEVMSRTHAKINRSIQRNQDGTPVLKDGNVIPLYRPINEANKTVSLGVFHSAAFGFRSDNGQFIAPGQIVNMEYVQKMGNPAGKAFLIIPVNKENGKTLYEVVEATADNAQLPKAIAQTILRLPIIYGSMKGLELEIQRNPNFLNNPLNKEKYDNYKSILEAFGIKSALDLQKYTRNFMREDGTQNKIHPLQYQASLREGVAKGTIPQGRIFISYVSNQDAKGNHFEKLVVHVAGRTLRTDENGNHLDYLEFGIGESSREGKITKGFTGKNLQEQFTILRNLVTDMTKSNTGQTYTFEPHINLETSMSSTVNTVEFNQDTKKFETKEYQSSQGESTYESVLKDIWTTDTQAVEGSDGQQFAASQASFHYEIAEDYETNFAPQIVRNDVVEKNGEVFATNEDGKKQKVNFTEPQRQFYEMMKDPAIREDTKILENRMMYMQMAKEIFAGNPEYIDLIFNKSGELLPVNEMSYAIPVQGGNKFANTVVDDVNRTMSLIEGVSGPQFNAVVNYIVRRIAHKFANNTSASFNVRSLFNEIQNELYGDGGYLSNRINNLNQIISRNANLRTLSPTAEKMYQQAVNELNSINQINAHFPKILNFSLNEVNRFLQLEIFEHEIRKGNALSMNDIDPSSLQDLIDGVTAINAETGDGLRNGRFKIEFVKYNEDGSVTVKVDNKEYQVELNNEDYSEHFESENYIDINEDGGTNQSDDANNWNRTNEKNWSQLSIQQDMKQNANAKTKMLLWSLDSFDENGNPQIGTFGLPNTETMDNYWKKLQVILTNNNVREMMNEDGSEMTESTARQLLVSDYESMIKKLQGHVKQQPWLNQLIQKLENGPMSLRNAFVTDMYKYNISMQKILVNQDPKGIRVIIFNVNGSAVREQIMENFTTDSNNSSLTTINSNGDRIYDKMKVKEALNRLSVIMEMTAPNSRGVMEKIQYQLMGKKSVNELTQHQKDWLHQVQQWMKDIGLNVSDGTMEHLATIGFPVTDPISRRTATMTIGNLFGSTGSGKLFGMLEQRLKEIDNKQGEVGIYADTSNQLTYNMNNYLGNLARIDSQYNSAVISLTYREGQKNINGITNFTFLTQHFEELSKSKANRDAKRESVFSQDSIELELMENDSYVDTTKIVHISPDAMAVSSNTYTNPNNGVTDLSELDIEFMKLSGIMNVSQGKVGTPTSMSGRFGDISMRVISTFNPTSSDKSQVFFWKHAGINFRAKDFTDGKINNNILEFLGSQVFTPELKRILKHFNDSRIGNNPNSLRNQDGFNYAAQHFHQIPEFNNIKWNDQLTLLQYIKLNPGSTLQDIMNNVNVRTQMTEIISNLIDNKVNEKIARWQQLKLWELTSTNEYYSGMIDNQYFDNQDRRTENQLLQMTNEQRIKFLAYDLVANNILSNANYNMLFAGDVANYTTNNTYYSEDANGKRTSDRFVVENNEVDVSRPLNENIWSEMNVDGDTDINMGKRLASMIGPRIEIANSQNANYIQLIANDDFGYPTNLKDLTLLHYDNATWNHVKTQYLDKIDAIKQDGTLSDDVKLSKITQIRKQATADKAISYLKPWFKIAKSDGQEYTTWKEHLDILYQYKGISDDVYQSLSQKLEMQSKGQFNEASNLTKDELKIVFQPLKPIYTGEYNDNGNIRKVYIKTSSFPLLPQWTQAFDGLNDLRKHMEKVQSDTKQNVRLTYASGIKTGLPNMNNVPALWTADGKFNTEGMTSVGTNNQMVLPRKYFGIQQDVPYKSQYNKEDKIVKSTQQSKVHIGMLMYSDVRTEIFTVNGIDYTGEQLYQRMSNQYQEWVGLEKRALYSQMGINPANNLPYNLQDFMNRIEGLLLSEAKQRGYGLQELDFLKLEPVMDAQGNVIDINFSMPLYLSTSATKYEGLLNAIITNRIINLKMPGNSYVIAAQSGTITQQTGISPEALIITGDYDGTTGLKDGYYDEQGKWHNPQAIISSKFRLPGGQFIDLLEKKGGQYVYLKFNTEKNRFELNEEMFDKELLTFTSFRIPYSGPQSGPSVDIVGIIPNTKSAVGDLMLVSSGSIVTMGEDFDIDKRYCYQHWIYKDKTGRIRKLSDMFGDIDVDSVIGIGKSLNNIFVNNLDGKSYTFLEYWNDVIRPLVSDKVVLQGILANPNVSISGVNTQMIRNFFTEFGLIAGNNDVVGGYLIDENLVDLFYDNIADSVNKFYKKIVQNELISGYNAINSSSNKTIQGELNKQLSTTESQQQADILQNELNKGKENVRRYDSILTDDYQTRKMISGADAKIGIAIFSNDVVRHSLMFQYNEQQTDPNQKIRLTETTVVDGQEVTSNMRIVFGNIVSEGILGERYGRDAKGNPITDKPIGDMYNELQNVSTDNEKLQLYYKLGLNKYTANVVGAMIGTGIIYDNVNINGESVRMTLPYLLALQPKVQEFVKLFETYKSNMSTFEYFESENERVLVEMGLVSKDGTLTELSQKWDNITEDSFKQLTGQNLFDNLTLQSEEVQLAALKFFLKMKDVSKIIGQTYNMINIQSGGIGTSIFDIHTIKETFNNMSNPNFIGANNMDNVSYGINNIGKLFGDYITSKEYSELESNVIGQEQQAKTVEQQKVARAARMELNRYMPYVFNNTTSYFKPTTINGSMIYNSIQAYDALFSNFFPFSPEFQARFEEVCKIFGINNKSQFGKTALRERVFKEFKKFTFSTSGLGLYEGNIQEQRQRLIKGDPVYEPDINVTHDWNIKYDVNSNQLLIKNENMVGSPSLMLFTGTSYIETGQETFSREIEGRGKFEITIRRAEKEGGTSYPELVSVVRKGKLDTTQSRISFTEYVYQLLKSDSNVGKLLRNNKLLQDFIFLDKYTNGSNNVGYVAYATAWEKNFDSRDIYNALNELVVANFVLDEIPGWNKDAQGNTIPYTSADLVYDLIIHSFLNSGGVQGPVSFLNKIPAVLLRNIQTNRGGKNTNLLEAMRDIHNMFNGRQNSVSRAADINSFFGVQEGMWSTVSKQIAQNLPKELPKIVDKQIRIRDGRKQVYNRSEMEVRIDGKDAYGDFIYDEQTRKNWNKQSTVIEVAYYSKSIGKDISGKNVYPPFVAMFDYSKKRMNNVKPYRVFELIGDKIYQEIEVLGDNIISEYDPGTRNLRTIMDKNMVDAVTGMPIQVKPNIQVRPQQTQDMTKLSRFKLNSGNIPTVLESIKNSNSQLGAIADLLNQLNIRPNVQIRFGNEWSYNNGVITVNQNDVLTQTDDYVASRILEEIIHATVNPLLGTYFNTQAFYSQTITADNLYLNKEGNPEWVSKLGSLFLQARRAMKKNNVNAWNTGMQDILNTMSAVRSGSQSVQGIDPSNQVYYGLTDIKEFAAHLLSDPGFIQEMNKLYGVKEGEEFDFNSQDNNKFGSKVRAWVKSVLNWMSDTLKIPFANNSIAQNGVDIMYDTIMATQNAQTPNGKMQLNVTSNELYNSLVQEIHNSRMTSEVANEVSERVHSLFDNKDTIRDLKQDPNIESVGVTTWLSGAFTGTDKLPFEYGNIFDRLARKFLTQGFNVTREDFISDMMKSAEIDEFAETKIVNSPFSSREIAGMAYDRLMDIKNTLEKDYVILSSKDALKVYQMFSLETPTGYQTKLINGEIDLFLINKNNGEITLVDVKTTRNIEEFNKHRPKYERQLNAYRIMMNNTNNITATKLAILPIYLGYADAKSLETGQADNRLITNVDTNIPSILSDVAIQGTIEGIHNGRKLSITFAANENTTSNIIMEEGFDDMSESWSIPQLSHLSKEQLQYCSPADIQKLLEQQIKC